MIPVADQHLPRLFSEDETSRPAPSRAVLKGIGRAIGMICGPVDRNLPQDLAQLVQRLPDDDGLAEPGQPRS